MAAHPQMPPRQHHAHNLSRLFIPPNLNSQQPGGFGGENAPMFSPSLPTAIQVGMHPQFPNALQTPMQANFFPQQPPPAPGRPSMHRAHASIAQLAAAGILPPGGLLGPHPPMTPLMQGGFPNTSLTPGNFPPPFVPRSKRNQSISTGGPPKAVLGGPQRKVSPLPQAAPVAAAAAPTAPTVSKKKVVVNLPKETVKNVEDGAVTKQSWARQPIPLDQQPDMKTIEALDLVTMEAYPSDAWRQYIPPTVDVFLPGKGAWDEMKRRIIEEKLEKLGVGGGLGSSSVPHIHAPHARAASISSPADPALLYFKLNKLQQSQNNSALNSLSTSPQPPIPLTPSPGSSSGLPPRFQGRLHGHSMSLAQPPSFQSQTYNPTPGFNPFGPNAILGSEQVQRISPGPRGEILAPQGRVPTNVSSLAPPPSLSRPESRPDFSRGFGLDTTAEEEEPPEDEPVATEVENSREEEMDMLSTIAERDRDDGFETERDGMSTVAQSRIHSRHVSKLSAALSLHSVGRNDSPTTLGVEGQSTDTYHLPPCRPPDGEFEVEDADADVGDDAVAEWTGSEDLGTGADSSDDESIGEWSNPSDEERARQQRSDRRARRAARRAGLLKRELEIPRRLPNFPRPPDTLPADDDIISNPSEEERIRGESSYLDLSSRPASQARPLPPLPHSRSTSAQFSYHDPAMAHSREGSEFSHGANYHRPVHAPAAPSISKEKLNPLAKPFVFGSPSVITHPAAPVPTHAAVLSASSNNHSRTVSLSKPLNVAAPEFKPGGFTFQFQPALPKLSPPPRPLPIPPVLPVTERASQGREKRQRRGSVSSFNTQDDESENDDPLEEREEKDTMHSFKFPPSPGGSKPMRHSAPASPPATGSELAPESGLRGAAQPFTFSGFTGPTLNVESPGPIQYAASEGAERQENSNTTVKVTEPEAADELPIPPTLKPKRAPIPLDFKHPVSTNTVPAGLFKNLNNVENEERTRRGVRSRLSSREFSRRSDRNSMHSLSDNNVLPISSRRATTSNRLFTDPGLRDTSIERDGIFSSSRRRSSLPPKRRDSVSSSSSYDPGMDVARQGDLEQFEERLEALLDEKIDVLKRELQEQRTANASQGITGSTEDMISEVVSLFRAQLQESAARGLEDSQMDARGELDFEVLKGIIEQSSAEARSLLFRELRENLARLNTGNDFKAFAEDLSKQVMHAVMSATSQVTMRMQAIEQSRPSGSNDREAIVFDIVSALTPQLTSLRAEPIDYEGLTAQLTQAVKPHISQLIDLASDKRETAGLIVDKLVPLLPSLPSFDTEGIVGRLTTEVRKIVGPVDAHEIKEQVSDLVVERLDSRLAVRDKAFNVDVVSDKVTENVRVLLTPLQDLKNAVDALGQVSASTKSPQVQSLDLSSVRQDITSLLSNLPEQLADATKALGRAQEEFASSKILPTNNDSSLKSISTIESSLSNLSEQQKTLIDQNQEFSDFCQDIVRHINALPETILEATKVIQNAHNDMLSRDTSQKDGDEIRRLMAANAEMQVALAKARGQHGQVRVEKDLLTDRVRSAESERERLRIQLSEVQTVAANKSAEANAMENRNRELEEALAQALERIKSSDVAAQTHLERITSLERTVQQLSDEKYQLLSKTGTLETAVTFANRERDTIASDLAQYKRQYEEVQSQQDQWDELRRVNEQMQALASLMSHSDSEELKELRRTRDRYRILEDEHAALQRRLKDQETKVANYERTAAAARQSLTQAQQRSTEWEERAQEYQEQLQSVQAKVSELEQAQSQLETDNSLLKIQVDERNADARLAKDRESKLRDQIANFEEQLARSRAENVQTKKPAPSGPVPQKSSHPAPISRQNGYLRSQVTLPRPDSRSSTVYIDSRSVTPVAGMNGSRPSSQQGIWDSIHAPKARRDNPLTAASLNRLPVTPQPKRPAYRVPSPTQSVVSAAPTLGEDGWWS